MTLKNHPYHLVDISPWPIMASLSVMSLMIGMIKWFHLYNMNLVIFSTISTFMIIYQWWRDISRESTFQGLHTYSVVMGMRWGMILFITSEIFFFISFFWAFFHSSLSPSIELGMIWPPLGITKFNPMQIPLLNTLILISSGISITWAHHSLMENNFNQMTQGLFITVILGIYFSILQAYEYKEASFSISDSVYGSSFFMATGFHGIHVLIGTTFLMICLYRHKQNHFSNLHHFGFEAAAWYWHFVDVVWLFLYISLYWWGSYLYSMI
uniref:Cytochrome c oxidase subunit 3 n=1 Tax=Ptiliidae sp. BMNH 1274724 TaxID=1796537 RepID=A0A126TGD8_9COLE|nr:cytochrome c oxidase subunit III [Ptiliidae sp. BMNH 1274724]